MTDGVGIRGDNQPSRRLEGTDVGLGCKGDLAALVRREVDCVADPYRGRRSSHDVERGGIVASWGHAGDFHLFTVHLNDEVKAAWQYRQRSGRKKWGVKEGQRRRGRREELRPGLRRFPEQGCQPAMASSRWGRRNCQGHRVRG